MFSPASSDWSDNSVRTSMPAETSSTSASASSVTTNALCSRRELRATVLAPRSTPSTPSIGTRSAGPRQNTWPERDKRLHACDGQQHANDAAGQSQYRALGQALPDHPCAAGAERDARRELAVTRDRPGQHQARDVHAGDEQHQRHGAQQQPERRAHVADDLALQRPRHHAAAGIRRRELLGQPARDESQLALDLAERDSRREPRRDAEEASEAIPHPRFGGLAERRDDVGVAVEAESCRRDANDPVRYPIEREPLTGDRASAETLLPQAVADDRNRRGTWPILFRAEDPPVRQRQTENGEQTR